VRRSAMAFETEDLRNEFSGMISLGYGSSLSATGQNRSFFISIARELNNLEFIF
jgi:hypothetical protein